MEKALNKTFCLQTAMIMLITIKDTKLYVSVVALSAKDNQNISKLLRKGSERSVYWNKCKTRSETRNTTYKCRYSICF